MNHQFRSRGRDLRAAIDHLVAETGVARVLVGTNTGGSIAICVGADDPQLFGVALLSPRADFDDWADHPRRFLDHAREIGAVRTPGFPRSMDDWSRAFRRFRPTAAARRLAPRPMLVMHGEDDESVPTSHARQLAQAHGDAELSLLPGNRSPSAPRPAGGGDPDGLARSRTLLLIRRRPIGRRRRCCRYRFNVSKSGLVVVIPSLDAGGTERQLVLLARGIARIDPAMLADTTIVTLRAGGALTDHLPSGLKVVSLGARHLWSPFVIIKLIRVLRTKRPAAVYSLLVPSILACVGASFAFRSRWIWGHRSRTYTVGASPLVHRAVGLALRWGARRADGIVVNSQAAAEYLTSIGIDRVPVRMIPNAIDSNDHFTDHAARSRTRAEIGATDEDTVVLSVGRLVADKDRPTLLRCFAEVTRHVPRARLVIIGGGTPEAVRQIEEIAEQLGIRGDVLLLGSRDALNGWYNAADVLIQSSVNEGSSNVILEAIAAGCPVVSTDCGDVRRFVAPSRIVSPGDWRALAVAVTATVNGQVSDDEALARPTTAEQLAADTLEFLEVGSASCAGISRAGRR